jgi:hypothetical protein
MQGGAAWFGWVGDQGAKSLETEADAVPEQADHYWVGALTVALLGDKMAQKR